MRLTQCISPELPVCYTQEVRARWSWTGPWAPRTSGLSLAGGWEGTGRVQERPTGSARVAGAVGHTVRRQVRPHQQGPRERLTVREGSSRGRGKSRGLRGSPVMGRQGWSLLSRPQVLHLGPRGVRLRGAHQAGVDGVPDDPALGVQQDGLHVRWVRARAALQPAPLQGAAVRTGPRPLGSSAPGRSRGSVGASHTLSSTAGTCSPGCTDTFTGMVLAHVQRPP